MNKIILLEDSDGGFTLFKCAFYTQTRYKKRIPVTNEDELDQGLFYHFNKYDDIIKAAYPGYYFDNYKDITFILFPGSYYWFTKAGAWKKLVDKQWIDLEKFVMISKIAQ